jgi:hypothetical protein
MIFFEIFQFVIKRRSKSAFVHSNAIQMNFSKIIVIFLNVLQIIINAAFMFLNKVMMKFIVKIRNEIFANDMNINSS